jgi:ribosomal protein S27E
VGGAPLSATLGGATRQIVKITESTNSDEGSEYKVRCVACQNETRHHVVFSLARHCEDADWWWIDNYQIIQCRGCGSPTFRHERIDADSDQYDEVTGESYLASNFTLHWTGSSRFRLLSIATALAAALGQ